MLKKNLIHFSSALDYCQANVSSILRVFSKNKVDTKTKVKPTSAYQSCFGAALQVATALIEGALGFFSPLFSIIQNCETFST